MFSTIWTSSAFASSLVAKAPDWSHSIGVLMKRIQGFEKDVKGGFVASCEWRSVGFCVEEDILWEVVLGEKRGERVLL
jgi:hypothetical protein